MVLPSEWGRNVEDVGRKKLPPLKNSLPELKSALGSGLRLLVEQSREMSKASVDFREFKLPKISSHAIAPVQLDEILLHIFSFHTSQ